MSNVLILANDYRIILNFRAELIRGLVGEGFNVAVALPPDENNALIEQLGCEVIDLKMSRRGTNPLADFKTLFAIIKILRRFKPVCVLTFTIKPNVYGGIACSLLRIPYIASITGLGTSLENQGLTKRISLFLYKLGLRKAANVFFQNTYNLQFMQNNKVYNGAYTLIPGSGVNLTKFTYHPLPQEDTLRFIFVGRVMKDKGINEFLAAAEIIKQKYPNTSFNIYGAYEDDYHEVLTKYQQAGIITYHGLVSNMAEVYQSCHCLIHPSYHEGMANVLLEAAATGRAIIASNIPGCQEAINDGVNGYVFKVKDVASLTEAIEKFIRLTTEEKVLMGKAGRQLMEERFDRRKVIAKYIDYVKSITQSN